MSATYKAVEVTSPGVFNLVERSMTTPGRGQVRIRVEACGVCHSDAATVLNQFPGLTYPRVPGHEVIGTIDEVGADVMGWKVGQRVGVGFSVDKMECAALAFGATSLTASIPPSRASRPTAVTRR